jgi:hypothetical protein
LAGLNSRRVKNSTRAGEHCTSKESRQIQRYVTWYHHDGTTIDHGMVREGRYSEVVINRHPVTTESTATTEEFAGTIGPYRFLAQCRSTSLASDATPTTGHKRKNDVIASAHVISTGFKD